MKTTPKKGKYTHLWALLLLSTLSIPALAPSKMTAPPANATSNSRALAGVVTEVQKDQRLMRSYRYSEQRLSQKGQFLGTDYFTEAWITGPDQLMAVVMNANVVINWSSMNVNKSGSRPMPFGIPALVVLSLGIVSEATLNVTQNASTLKALLMVTFLIVAIKGWACERGYAISSHTGR